LAIRVTTISTSVCSVGKMVKKHYLLVLIIQDLQIVNDTVVSNNALCFRQLLLPLLDLLHFVRLVEEVSQVGVRGNKVLHIENFGQDNRQIYLAILYFV